MYHSVVALAFLLLSAVGVMAQEPSREISPELRAQLEAQAALEEATLIADVNFREVSTSTEAGKVIVEFGLENTYGRQDGISYGVVFRSLTTGELLASISAPEQFTLTEGEKRKLSFSYEIPSYLSQSASAILSAYNREGLPLAFQVIDTVRAGDAAVSCSSQNDVVKCSVSKVAEAHVVIRDGSPQGEVVKEFTSEIDSSEGINLLEAVETLSPGRYVTQISVRDTATDEVLGTYASDFTKPGDFGKIMSVSPLTTDDGKLQVIVYAEVGYYASVEPLTVQANLGECASEQTLPFDYSVKTFTFDTSCSTGVVEAKLMAGAVTLDTLQVGFGDSVQSDASDEQGVSEGVGQSVSEKEGGALMLFSVVVIGILLLGVLIWYFYVRGREPKGDAGTPPVPPLMFALIIMAGLTFTATAEAATFAIGGTPSYNTCAVGSGMSCAEPDFTPGPTTAGTVTVPDSVAQGSTYTVTYTIQTTTSSNTLCNSPNVPCGPSNTVTYVYDTLTGPGFDWVGMHLVSTYNSLPAGYHGSRSGISRPLIHYKDQGTSGSFTRTAPSSGTVDTLSFLTQPNGTGTPGPWVASCSPQWCLTYPYARRNATVNLTAPNAAPTANAGSDRVITLPSNSVTISGASATDSDGTISSISWSGPAGITISGGTTLTPTFSGFNTAGAGTYTFTLTVRDNAGATDTDTVSVSAFAAAPSCGWATTAYLGLNTGNPGMHNTTRCSTPAPSDGTPNNAYCDSAGENGTTVVCCDSGADCYRYTCNYGGSCTASVQLNFQ